MGLFEFWKACGGHCLANAATLFIGNIDGDPVGKFRELSQEHLASLTDYDIATFSRRDPKGKKVRFATTTAMVTHLLEARESRTLARSQKQLERLDLLILDELGYVPFSKTGAELLFEVLQSRQTRGDPRLFHVSFHQRHAAKGRHRLVRVSDWQFHHCGGPISD